MTNPVVKVMPNGWSVQKEWDNILPTVRILFLFRRFEEKQFHEGKNVFYWPKRYVLGRLCA